MRSGDIFAPTSTSLRDALAAQTRRFSLDRQINEQMRVPFRRTSPPRTRTAGGVVSLSLWTHRAPFPILPEARHPAGTTRTTGDHSRSSLDRWKQQTFVRQPGRQNSYGRGRHFSSIVQVQISLFVFVTFKKKKKKKQCPHSSQP